MPSTKMSSVMMPSSILCPLHSSSSADIPRAFGSASATHARAMSAMRKHTPTAKDVHRHALLSLQHPFSPPASFIVSSIVFSKFPAAISGASAMSSMVESPQPHWQALLNYLHVDTQHHLLDINNLQVYSYRVFGQNNLFIFSPA